jgi:hypothetical protein
MRQQLGAGFVCSSSAAFGPKDTEIERRASQTSPGASGTIPRSVAAQRVPLTATGRRVKA